MVPIIIGSFFFPFYQGLFLVIFAKSFGSLFFYICFYSYFSKRNFFIKLISLYNFKPKKNLLNLFQKNKFLSLVLLRLCPLPVVIADTLPLFFNVKIINFFFSKFIGSIIPHFFYMKAFNNFFIFYRENKLVTFKDFFNNQELYISCLFLIFFIYITNRLYNKYLK